MKFYTVEKVPITEIGCGSVVQFTPRTETVTVLVPQGLARPDQVETMIVRGPSLTEHGIYDGDVIAYRTNFTNKSITPDSVCVVRIITTGELLAKKIIVTGTNKIALRSSGGGIEDRYFDIDDIEVIGLVFGAQKLADRYGRFDHKPTNGHSNGLSPKVRKAKILELMKRFEKPKEEEIPF